MKIGLRGGHSPNAKGAFGILDEQAKVRELYYEVEKVLKAYGHTVINCNSDASTVSGELNEGTNKANSAKCDYYITLHMNASNGQGRGTEAWCYNSSGEINNIANQFCSNMNKLGFYNRGVKYNTGYHDLNKSNMPASIFEVLFCDNQGDVDIWRKSSWDTLARCVANAIDPKIPLRGDSSSSSSSGTSYNSEAKKLLFNSDYYYKKYIDLQKAIGNNADALYKHWLDYGIKEGRSASIIFDPKYYIANNEDLKKAFGTNYEKAQKHFLENGINEWRLTSADFNVNVYRNKNVDLQKAFSTNCKSYYLHYVEFGINEGRTVK